MSKKITRFGRICVTYVLIFAIAFSFVMSSFVGLNITASAETTPTPSAPNYWKGNKPTSLDGLSMGGEGTEASPYQITNADQLWYAVNNTDPTKYFKVMNDINIYDDSNFASWDNSSFTVDWDPTGVFSGTFDGNGKTISGLYSAVSASERKYVGLFARLGSNAKIYNIIIENSYVTSVGNVAMSAAGVLVGTIAEASNVLVYGCVVKNSKVGQDRVSGTFAGGLIGGVYLNTGSIAMENCAVIDLTIINGYWAAAITGGEWCNYFSAKNCYTNKSYINGEILRDIARYKNCYTADTTIEKPFKNAANLEETIPNVFSDTSVADRIYKISEDAMKGTDALTNLKLSPLDWEAKDGEFPMPRLYSSLNGDFKAEYKNTDSVTFVGTGTASDPYQITNSAELWKAVNNTDSTKHFKVMNNIAINDTSAFDYWNDILTFVNWDPTATFVGTFDGNGKTISGLYASFKALQTGDASETEEEVLTQSLGLFAKVGNNASISNVILENAYIAQTGKGYDYDLSYVGGIVGMITGASSSSRVSNVNIYGCVVRDSKLINRNNTGENSVAGILGCTYNTSAISIKNCTVEDTDLIVVDATRKYAAGICASYWVTEMDIANCFVTGYPIGFNSSGAVKISNCYVGGDVEYPFDQDTTKAFGEASGIYKIASIDNMKGITALDAGNMDLLSPLEWTLAESKYPTPKSASELKGEFKPEYKNTDSVTFIGTGTISDPYQITNSAELWKAVNNTDPTRCFKVMNDIVINDTTAFNYWNDNLLYEDWHPTAKFRGTFDGNSKTISGLYSSAKVTDTTNHFVGLFASLGSDTTVYNVILENAYVTASGNVGMSAAGVLVGTIAEAANVLVYGCVVKNSKVGNDRPNGAFAGGLIGGVYLNTGSIAMENCAVIDLTIINGHWAAAITGGEWDGNFRAKNCYTNKSYINGEKLRDIAKYKNCYTADTTIEKPFKNPANLEETVPNVFSDTSVADRIYKISEDAMKGANALENLKLSADEWTATDSYPMPKPYEVEKNVWDGSKTITSLSQLEGEGTSELPYVITNGEELWFAVNNTSMTPSGKVPYFRLGADIKINKVAEYNNWSTQAPANSWLPTATFVGHFDGNYKTITGLYAAPTSSVNRNLGLFAGISNNSSIKNLTLTTSYIKGTESAGIAVGGIVGEIALKSNISLSGLCVKDCILEGYGSTGGIVGFITKPDNLSIEYCSSVDNTLTCANNGPVGGIFGNSQLVEGSFTVKECFTTGYYITYRSTGITFDKVYTTKGDKPFASETTAFNDNVKKISIDDIKGENAVANLVGFDANRWSTTDTYPVVKPYTSSNDFKASDKTLTVGDLQGTGTKEDPKQITNAAELWAAVNNTDAELYFKVMDNIVVNDATDFYAWNDSSGYENWIPTEAFAGYFDGNKKVISGLYAVSSSEKAIGLFSKLGSDARLVDIIIDNAYFAYTGTSKMTFVGGLAGTAVNVVGTSVYGCVVKNSRIANRFATNTEAGEAGLIAAAYATKNDCDLTIKNCYTVDNIYGGVAPWSSGIIAGNWIQKLILVDCFTTDRPISFQLNSISVTNCYVAGDVDYPYILSTNASFGESTNIYKINKSEMKGADALKNMKFKPSNWEATDSYPVSKLELVDTNGEVGTVWSGVAARIFAGGSGTEEDPWQIDTPERFALMLSKYGDKDDWFVLTEDIKLNDTTASDWYNSDTVKTWPVGKKFIGHFDGQGRTVSGLYVENKSGSQAGAGLFPQVTGNATIVNVNIDHCYAIGNMNTYSYTSMLVGYIPHPGIVTIEGCNVSNALVDSAYIFGGIVGYTYTAAALINYCTFQGELCSESYGTTNIGGILGSTYGTPAITNCISKGIAALGYGYPPLVAVYSDVNQNESTNKTADVILLNSEEMIGSAAKEFMPELNWDYMETNLDGIPTVKPGKIKISTELLTGERGKVWSGYAALGFAGGTGTQEDPYLIETPEQLYMFSLWTLVNNSENMYFKITSDIYLNDVSDKDWKQKSHLNSWLSSAVGPRSPHFAGNLDGDYHVIYGLYANHNTEQSAFALIPRAKGNAKISKLGMSQGYMSNLTKVENFGAAFIGFINSEGSDPIPVGEYTPVRFTECFVDDTFEVNAYFAGGFVAGAPIGVDFVDCYANPYVTDAARYSGAFIGYAWFSAYCASFTNCYAYPTSKWTQFSSLIFMQNPETNQSELREGTIVNSYYFGSRNTYFTLLFYKNMHGDLAKTNMTGFDFDNVWKTVDGGTPVLRGFANAEKFSSKRTVTTKVSFVTGTEGLSFDDIEGQALSPLTLPVPEREGYFFEGWYVYEEGNCKYDYGTFPVVDTTLYAKWMANSVSQNFENYVATIYDYDDDYQYYRPGIDGYSSLKVHGGGKAMLRKGESADEQDFILNATEPLAAGDEYTMRFWVANETPGAKATISLVHYTWPDFQDPDLGVEKMVDIESVEAGEWTEYTYKFKAKTPWLGIRTTGNAKLYLDDFFIAPVGGTLKDANLVNDYDYFYSLGEPGATTTSQSLSGLFSTQVNTLSPTSDVLTNETNKTIAFLATVILAASSLAVLSRVSLGSFKQEVEKGIEE